MDTEKSIKDQFGDDSVENVELLFAKNIVVQDVPVLEYMQTENQDGIVHVDVDAHQIPVIDMSKVVGGDEDELAKLHLACKDWGFFQLINHGVSEQVMDKIKKDMAEFFKLPHEEKIICAQLPDDVDGYCVQSKEQKRDIYWRDSLLVTAQPVNLRKMQFWPTTPHSFRASVDEYSSEVQKVSKCLLRMMAKNLQLDTEKLVSLFEDGLQAIKMNYYPPCTQPNKVNGLHPHSDLYGLTLLIQANEVEGLQIYKDGKWLPIKPIPCAFIVIIGDVVEILSNSEYKSIWHRAVVNKEKERLSIAAFHNPNRKIMIGPLPELMKDDKAAVYKSITYDEYMSQAFIMIREGKNRLEEMKIRPVN